MTADGGTDENDLSRLWIRARRHWAIALVGGLAVSLLLVVIVAGMTSTAAFEPYNPDWDGTSEFRTDVDADPNVDAEIVTDTNQYDVTDPHETVAFVIAPEAPYTGADADRVRTFVERGGTLVVLEDADGYGGDLLERTGAEARLGDRFVLDERERVRGPAMPIASETATHALTDDVDQLVLYHATTVEPNGATVLVGTSEYSYLGENATAVPSEGTELESHPVATTESVGDGTVVAIADPSVATNAMYGQPDNAQFLANQYAGADRVVFDRSHGPEPPPITAAVLAIRTSPELQFLVGSVGIAAVVAAPRVAAALSGSGRRSDAAGVEGDDRQILSDEDLVAAVCRRHPDWDPDRVRTMITSHNRDQERTYR
ncbi:DUF4350 domain-containing protein [Natronococcus sp. A-GB7]|uniref:DUF4350 domain-containing protein n=1 Tax=Natronococcus sp. A-GB7 TaxID=3037649 RepID=UPI00241C8D59|nr:DUF4350 domain-containing protein [Natronococcus sp. A-GB7]MDG5819743.1 DUF4350 domain-containing protein [Natronococcus sp. A-GB7]